MKIDAATTPLRLAAMVSQALQTAGIPATLSGGGAVSIYTDNEYESADLDFVTSARTGELQAALRPLGFELAEDRRHFRHPDTPLFLEFPPGPLAFGSVVVAQEDIPARETPWGPLRIVTPTLCVMDRLSAFWHWSDRPSWDQALMLIRAQPVDRARLLSFAEQEGREREDIDRLFREARRSRG